MEQKCLLLPIVMDRIAARHSYAQFNQAHQDNKWAGASRGRHVNMNARLCKGVAHLLRAILLF
eukprot:1883491-Rhodomonas_salina.1